MVVVLVDDDARYYSQVEVVVVHQCDTDEGIAAPSLIVKILISFPTRDAATSATK